MFVALWGWTPSGLQPRRPRPAPGAIRAACVTCAATPELAVPLALMALVGTLGFNFQVVLPLLAKFSFDGGAGTYAALVSAMGVGSIVGASSTAPAAAPAAPDRRRGARLRPLRRARRLDADASPRAAPLALVGAARVTFAAT